ncbi:MAG: solute carrier family 26 protein [Armatimonadota bacterium]
MTERIRLAKLIPGLAWIRGYDRSFFKYDLVAGLSVAAVALPTGIAYAPLVGVPPVYGIYASILSLVAYALFGSSRQLIVGPDAATAVLVGAALTNTAGGDTSKYVGLAATLTLMTGLICVIAGVIRLGFVANFLARPILMGFMNGVGLSIIAGQLSKLFGYSVPSTGFFRTIFYFFSKIGQTNIVTLIVGVSAFVLLMFLRRKSRRIPAPLIAVIAGIIAAAILDLGKYGVAAAGTVPAGLPPVTLPHPGFDDLEALILGSIGIAIVGFSSGMVTARSFAAKNGYDLDANQEFIGLGMANIAAGISQGFAVSGTDSRTAISDSTGGKTQMTGIIAAVVMLVALLILTAPLAYLPVAVIGAVLISAAVGLFNFPYMKYLWSVSKPDFLLAVVTSLGVITVGVLPGILVAVTLAMVQILKRSSRPPDAILGEIPGIEGYFDVAKYPEAEQLPGLVMYRIDSAILFFNADYLRTRAREITSESMPEWFILDAESIPMIDTTAVDHLDKALTELKNESITFALARPNEQVRDMIDRTGLAEKIGEDHIFRSVRSAVDAFRNRNKMAQ